MIHLTGSHIQTHLLLLITPLPFLSESYLALACLASQPLAFCFGFRASIFLLLNSISAPSMPALCITPAVPSSHELRKMPTPIGFDLYLVIKLLNLNPSRFIFSLAAATSIVC